LAICSTCNRTFEVKRYRANTARYCSNPCRRQRVPRTCPICQKEFTLTPAFVREVNCCSRPCQYEWMRTHVNEKWLRAGQVAAKARWDSMTPTERVEKSNIKALLASMQTPRARKLLSDTKRGERNPMKRPEVAEKVSASIKKKWGPFFSEQMKRSWRDGNIPFPWQKNGTTQLPNAKERALLDILIEAAPTFRYVGNQAFWIGPCASGQRRNPDFIDGPQKKAILLHGEYWHPKESAEIEEQDYMSKGWKVLVVWSKELRRKDRPAFLLRVRNFASQLS